MNKKPQIPLDQLLALKRHEQPAPLFFERFSDRVKARIQAEEVHRSPYRLVRWWEQCELRPLAMGACGVAFSSALVLGLGVATAVPPSQEHSDVNSLTWLTDPNLKTDDWPPSLSQASKMLGTVKVQEPSDIETEAFVSDELPPAGLVDSRNLYFQKASFSMPLR